MPLVLLTKILSSLRCKLFAKGRGTLLLAIVFFTQLSYAQGAATTAQIGSGRHLVNVTLALMGIIGLIFAISWFVKRFSQGAFSANAHIKVLSAMPLGTRERIVLIEAGGQQLLLGITSTNINTLHVFETPIVVDGKTENPSDFSRKLMAILQQKSSLTPMQDSNNKNDSAP
jgi:flagellar protein FliO/FliZ